MPQRFYEIQRPRQEQKLPSVLSEEEVLKVISATANLKHKAILVTIYSCGLVLNFPERSISFQCELITSETSQASRTP
jgi:site-specific recombinase XerD